MAEGPRPAAAAGGPRRPPASSAPSASPASPAVERGRGASSRSRALRQLAVAVALLAVVGLGALTAASFAGAPHNSVAQSDEHGVKALADALASEGFGVQVLGAGPHALDALDPATSAVVVAGVERAYTAGEVQAVRAYVERGGLAVIADDFGHGDTVGAAFGVNFDKLVLRDAHFDLNQSLVKVNATLAGRNYSLLANVPSSLGFGAQTRPEVLAESSTDSYIDTDLDGQESPSDAKGPFPVIGLLGWGQGRALFVSDPGLLTNGLAKDNLPFWRAFFRASLPEGSAIAFDESRHPQGPPAAVLGTLLAGITQATSEPLLALAFGVALLFLAVAAYASFRAPPDIVGHRSRLDEAVHDFGDEARAQRLRGLAVQAVASKHSVRVEGPEEPLRRQLAGLAADPVLSAVILGQPVRATSAEILERIRAQATTGVRS